MLAAGLRAVLTCVDPKQLSERFVGRHYDEALLAELPAGVDPCGERGEFHTFCFRCPQFSTEAPFAIGEVVERGKGSGSSIWSGREGMNRHGDQQRSTSAAGTDRPSPPVPETGVVAPFLRRVFIPACRDLE